MSKVLFHSQKWPSRDAKLYGRPKYRASLSSKMEILYSKQGTAFWSYIEITKDSFKCKNNSSIKPNWTLMSSPSEQ